LFSFYDSDHGDGTITPLRLQVERQLAAVGVDIRGGVIKLLCMPRTFGYSFNPLSVYFCHDAVGTLAALIYQVHNTFGERHSYVLSVDRSRDAVYQHCQKSFYVSPFMEMKLEYKFRVKPPDEDVKIVIHARDRMGILLSASLAGVRQEFTDRRLLLAAVSVPLVTFKVIAAIHWEALRLWLKSVPRSESRMPRRQPQAHPHLE
jgi:uncharacterized protein